MIYYRRCLVFVAGEIKEDLGIWGKPADTEERKKVKEGQRLMVEVVLDVCTRPREEMGERNSISP